VWLGVNFVQCTSLRLSIADFPIQKLGSKLLAMTSTESSTAELAAVMLGDPSSFDRDGYTNAVAKLRKDRPPREYEHPVVVIGAGMGGINVALDLQRRGRKNFAIFERTSVWGGATWNDVANFTTKLQTEKGSYHCKYLDVYEAVDPNLKSWPSRDALQEMLQTHAETEGLDNKVNFDTTVLKVNVQGDPLNGGCYKVTTEDSDGATTDCLASAIVACVGVFFTPKDITFPGQKEFGGCITHGSYDDIRLDKLKGSSVLILGHGGFTIENVRTCVEYKASAIKIVCNHRHFSGPKMTSWMVSATEYPIPGHVLLKSFAYMYDLLGFDVWSHPGVTTDDERTYAVIRQSTTFGVTDIYFLAFAYGLVELFQDKIEKLTHHCAHLEKGNQVECQVILKCLGSDADPSFDDVMGTEHIKGFWINNDPLRASIAMTRGVLAKNYGSFSVGPFFASAVTSVNYFIDYPEDLAGILNMLPPSTATDKYPAYYMSGELLSPLGMALGSVPDLSFQLQTLDKLKAFKTQEGHPKEAHLAECQKEWAMYTAMMKEHGQIPADAPEIPYPYTLGIIDELLADSAKYWQEVMAKKTKQ